MIHYPTLSSRQEPQKVVIRFEVRSFLSSGYFLSHLAIPAKLHGPKGDRINESLLYYQELRFGLKLQ